MQLTSLLHETKRKINSGQKFGSYAAILSGKNDCLLNISVGEQFASFLLTSAISDFTLPPRMHKVSTGPKAH